MKAWRLHTALQIVSCESGGGRLRRVACVCPRRSLSRTNELSAYVQPDGYPHRRPPIPACISGRSFHETVLEALHRQISNQHVCTHVPRSAPRSHLNSRSILTGLGPAAMSVPC